MAQKKIRVCFYSNEYDLKLNNNFKILIPTKHSQSSDLSNSV